MIISGVKFNYTSALTLTNVLQTQKCTVNIKVNIKSGYDFKQWQ